MNDDRNEAKRHAEGGEMHIDIDPAARLLARLDALRERTAELVGRGAELDRPLRFGDNWVGHIVSQRLRGVAVDDRGLAPALSTFHQVLDDVAAAIRLAAGRYRTSDDEAVAALGRCAR